MNNISFRYETNVTALHELHSFVKVFREFAIVSVCKEIKSELRYHPAMPLDKDSRRYDIESFITGLDFNPIVDLYFFPLKDKTLIVMETYFHSVSLDASLFPYIVPIEISKNSSENQEKKKDWEEFYHIYAHELGGKYWDRHFKIEVVNTKILVKNSENLDFLKKLLIA